MNNFSTFDEYIALFPDKVRLKLQEFRTIIHNAAPDAHVAISYAMPTFKLNGNLVHFAAYKNHFGFYPAPSAIVAFKNELLAYHTSKGAIQFPIDKPLPKKLIESIVKFRVRENLQKKQ